MIGSIKSATEALSTELQKIGEWMSKNPPQAEEAPKQEGEVKDAEVNEEKKDEEKK